MPTRRRLRYLLHCDKFNEEKTKELNNINTTP